MKGAIILLYIMAAIAIIAIVAFFITEKKMVNKNE